MAKRKGFVVYFEWVDMMRELDGETFKRLILDMRSYADTGRAPEYLKEEEKLLRMAWALLQNRMDADADRYADIVQKRKEAAEPDVAIAIFGEKAAHGSSLAPVAEKILLTYYEMEAASEFTAFENQYG